LTRRLLILAGMLALLTSRADARDYRIGSIQIDHPWALATPKGAKVGGGYMTITNNGSTPDRLIALSSPAARRLVIHRQTLEGDVSKMRAVEDGLEIKPGETLELRPGGLHIMFEELREPLVEATRVKGTVVFEQAGAVDVEYAVQALGKQSAPENGHHNH
jgi:periplasmic copper chaperone A